MNLHYLRKELLFAAFNTVHFSDAVRLLAHTAEFHLRNRISVLGEGVRTTSVNIRIGDTPHRLHFRTGRAGDLFILYEVLAFSAFQIPRSLLDPASVRTIIDCGANIGVTSLYLAQVYPNARIISIEPQPDNFALLLRNTENVPQIEALHAAVVGTSRPSVAFSTKREGWAGRISEDGGIQVPAITLDEVLRFSLSRVDLLKVDIEGAEAEVFAHGSYLDRVQHVVAELHEPYTCAAFAEAMRRHGLSERQPDAFCIATTAHRA
jgi:FkbM family methyltransferase